MEETIRDYLARYGVQALVRLVTAPDAFAGAERLVETYGLGPLVPNTIILGDSEVPAHRNRFCRMIGAFHKARRNVVILRDPEKRGFGRRRHIDIWWRGLQPNGGLMLILAYLLRTSVAWREAEVRLKLVVPDAAAAEKAGKNLSDLVAQLRVGAVPQVLVSEGRPFPEVLRESSADADLVFLGMAEPGKDFTRYYEQLQTLATGLPTTVFVLAAENLPFSGMLLE